MHEDFALLFLSASPFAHGMQRLHNSLSLAYFKDSAARASRRFELKDAISSPHDVYNFVVQVHQDKDDWSQSVYEMWQESCEHPTLAVSPLGVFVA